MEWTIKISETSHKVEYKEQSGKGGVLYVDGIKIVALKAKFRMVWYLEYSFSIDGVLLVLKGFDNQYDLIHNGICVGRNMPYKSFSWI